MKARFSTYSCNGNATGCSREIDAQAAQGFAPDVLVTDKLRSYGAAKAELGLSARHEQGLRKNNRAENSHQPTAAGAQDAALQIAGISPTLSIHSGRRQPRPVRTCGARAFPQTTRRRRWSSVTGAAVWTAVTAARGKHGTGSHRRSGYRQKCRDHARWRGFSRRSEGARVAIVLNDYLYDLNGVLVGRLKGRHVIDANTRSMPIGFRKLLEGKS
jgi:hypothetical protein